MAVDQGKGISHKIRKTSVFAMLRHLCDSKESVGIYARQVMLADFELSP